MKLYLVQHGEAFSKEEYADRPLTEKGCLDAEKTADFIKSMHLEIAEVLHSGKTRALQTAKIFYAAVKSLSPLSRRSGLDPNDDAGPLADEINAAEKDMMIVGHLPFLSRLTSLLLTGSLDLEPVVFQNAGILCLEKSAERWQLVWMITPQLLQ